MGILSKAFPAGTGVVVDFILYPEADATTKLNLELSTKGDLGDMINIQMDRAMLVTYGGQGVLAPLNDLMKQYGFGMKVLMDTFPGSYEAITAPDGNIYVLPFGNLICIFPNSYAERFWIQSEFLAKLMKEGLMDQNYVNNDRNTFATLVTLNGGKTAATLSCGGLHYASTDMAIRNMYEIVPPLKGPDGFVNAFYDHYTAGVTPSKVTIPAKSTKKDIVMAWMDSNYDQEVAFRGRYGETGTGWKIPAAGTVAVDGGPAMYEDISNKWGVPQSSHWYTATPALWGRYRSMTSAYDANWKGTLPQTYVKFPQRTS